MRRGEVYDADFEPVQGSEQGGTRPAIIVSNDSINASSQVVLVLVPLIAHHAAFIGVRYS